MDRSNLFDQSLIVLKFATLEKFGLMMNPNKFLMTHDGKLRDWRGLADFAKLDATDRLRVQASANYTREIITIWCKKASQHVTVRDLMNCLQSLDRFDVLDDMTPTFEKDCEDAPQGLVLENLNQGDYTRALSMRDFDALARSDVLTRLNAMVLFNDEDEDDARFGMHVVQRMESAGLSVFVPQRDLVAGTAEHATSAEIIKERCDKVVAIFSPSFLKSRGNVFLINFAQHSDIKYNTSKIIPIIFKSCDLPRQLDMIHKLPYKDLTVVNFWEKLLNKTFGIKNIAPQLKLYDPSFPFLGSETKRLVLSDATRSESSTDTTSTATTSNSLFTTSTVLSAQSQQLVLPSPPTHDPALDNPTTEKQKSKKKKSGLIDKLSSKIKKHKKPAKENGN